VEHAVAHRVGFPVLAREVFPYPVVGELEVDVEIE
jgi:hypothetical protein